MSGEGVFAVGGLIGRLGGARSGAWLAVGALERESAVRGVLLATLFI